MVGHGYGPGHFLSQWLVPVPVLFICWSRSRSRSRGLVIRIFIYKVQSKISRMVKTRLLFTIFTNLVQFKSFKNCQWFCFASSCLVLGDGPDPRLGPGPGPSPEPKLVPVLGSGPFIFLVPALVPVKNFDPVTQWTPGLSSGVCHIVIFVCNFVSFMSEPTPHRLLSVSINNTMKHKLPRGWCQFNLCESTTFNTLVLPTP